MAEPKKDNLDITNTQPGVSGGSGTPPKKPAVPPPVVEKKENLPGSHLPTVSLPSISGDPTPPPPPSPKPVPPPKEKKGVKPKDVSLPEKGKPEIFIEEKAGIGGGKPKIEIPDVAKSEDQGLKGVQPVLETGGVKKKKSPKMIIKFVGSAILGLVLLGGILIGVLFLRDLFSSRRVPDEEIPPPPTELPPIVEREVDLTSLDALEKAFDGIGGQLEILEENADFENKIDSKKIDF